MFSMAMLPGAYNNIGSATSPASILFKSISDRYRPVRNTDGPIPRSDIDLSRLLAVKSNKT